MTQPKIGLLIVISGPSGVGKDTVLRRLFEMAPELKYSVSYTTRPPRPGEVDGHSYTFVSEPEFLRLIEQKEFLEWAKVYDHYYGTSRRRVEAALDRGEDIILKIDVQGAEKVRRRIGAAGTYIYLLPPSVEALEQRLVERATEDPASLQARHERALAELALKDTYDHQVVNDDARRAAREIEAIIQAARSAAGGSPA